jgi:phosphatidylethanolamine/phosphatidyl-N-methylethanolamine N-methyltransferase
MTPFDTPGWNRFRYSLYAPIYDSWVGRVPVFTRGRRRAHELAALRSGETVLLVAAGTGLDLPLLPAGVRVIAGDIAPGMVRRLRARAESLGLGARVEEMDAARLPLPDASVDCVLLHLALAVVPDPVATIREAARVLRPGGRISVFDKFLPDDRRPSLLRRLVDVVANVIATRVNQQLGPLARAAALRVVRREATGLGVLFVAARLEHETGSATLTAAAGTASGPEGRAR